MKIDLARLVADAKKARRARRLYEPAKQVRIVFRPKGSTAKGPRSPRPEARILETGRGLFLEIASGRGPKTQLPLSASADDDVEVIFDGGSIVVYGENTRYDYCGIEVFSRKDGEWRQEREVFLQGDEQIRDVLGKKGLDLTTKTKVRYLLNAM
jgi:hypothetical protein